VTGTADSPSASAISRPDPTSNRIGCRARPDPFGLTFRTYLPDAAIRDGEWTAPPVRCIR